MCYNIMSKERLYVAMILKKTVEMTEPISGKTIELELGGATGYLPVFETETEALKHAEHIFVIELVE